MIAKLFNTLIITLILASAHAAPSLDCKVPTKNSELFLSSLEAGFMSPGYYVYRGKSSKENLALNIEYQTGYFGSTRTQPFSKDEIIIFSQIFATGGGILNADGDIGITTDFVDKTQFDSATQFLTHRILTKPIPSWNPDSIADLFLQTSGILLNDSKPHFREGITTLRRTDILGSKLRIDNHPKFLDFIKKNHPKDLEVYNALRQRVIELTQTREGKDQPCYTGDGKPTSCPEDMHSEKNLWQAMIIQSNTNSDRWRQGGRLWARAIPFLARFYKFFPFSNPKELRNKFVKIIEDTKKLYKTDPFEAAVFIHQALVKLHPLENGNGRMARFMMNIVLRQAGYPSVAMLNEQSYSSAVSGSSFSEFLTNRVCTTARTMREQGDSYGADISLLAQKCIQKTRKYYIEGHKEEADPVPECQNSFRLLLADYEQTRDEL